jgi:hypothetical protein
MKNIYFIFNSTAGDSEIWKYSELEKKLYYFKAFRSVGDIVKLPEGEIITYMDRIEKNFTKFYTKTKIIEKWREYPFVFFE